MHRFVLSAGLTMLVLLIIICAGCGGGGSAVDAISGQVLVPGGAALLTRALDPAASGVTVTLGTVDDNGVTFTALPGASTTTDANGRYSIPLPAGVTPNPRLNVLVGSVAAPTLASVVMDRSTDIRPASTAARETLYTLARATSTPLSSLNGTAVRSFLAAAITTGQAAETGTSLSATIDASSAAMNAAPAIRTALNAVVPIAPTALAPTRLSPQFSVVGQTTRVTISGYGLAPAPVITENANPARVTASVVSAADTSLIVDFAIPLDAVPGNHYFTMRRTVAGNEQTAGIMLYVRSLTDSPVLLSVSPNSGIMSVSRDTAVNVTLTGTAFNVPDATVYFTAGAMRVTNVRVLSASTITATVTIPAGHATGTYLMAVRTASGTSGGATFNVLPPEGHDHVTPPTLTGITPNSYTIQAGGAQSQQLNVHLTGTLFQSGLTVAPYLQGPCYFTNVRNITATGCDATLVVDKGFGVNNVSVTIINGDGGVSNSLSFQIH